jgi:hypothetical protein
VSPAGFSRFGAMRTAPERASRAKNDELNQRCRQSDTRVVDANIAHSAHVRRANFIGGR